MRSQKRRRPTRPLHAITSSASSASTHLQAPELQLFRSRLSPTLTFNELHAFLVGLGIIDADFCTVMFELSSLQDATTVSVESLIFVYAVLRRLAKAGAPSNVRYRPAAEEAAWLAFAAASRDAAALTLAHPRWLAFASRLGEAVGGVDSLPADDARDAMCDAWRAALPRRKRVIALASAEAPPLSFEQFLSALRVCDVGVLAILQAVAVVLVRAVHAAAGIQRPHVFVYDLDKRAPFLSQYLLDMLDKSAQPPKPQTQPLDGAVAANVALASSSGSASTNRTARAGVVAAAARQQQRQRPRPTLFPELASSVRGAPQDSMMSMVTPSSSPGSSIGVNRRSQSGKVGKTPFHIDFSSLDLGERIGSGAYGEVYHGRFLKSPVAVKMFTMNLDFSAAEESIAEKNRATSSSDGAFRRLSTVSTLKRFASKNSVDKYMNFLHEVEMMSVVRHPNLVLYIGATGDPLTPLCIVTELFTGGSLHDFLHSERDFRPSKACAISFALNIARGMYYLHSSQPSILHRDLKARNVLLSGRKGGSDIPHVVICDFGLCQLFGNKTDEDRKSELGTASYMSPDVIRGDQYEAFDDVYSFGVLMFEIFTGDAPYEGLGAMQVMYRVSNESLRPWCIGGDVEVDDNVRSLIERCWHEDKAARPSFATIIDELDDLAKQHDIRV